MRAEFFGTRRGFYSETELKNNLVRYPYASVASLAFSLGHIVFAAP